ncbi:hypothetical protein PL11_007220 [Lentilactobacillus curieae]|uniref:Uncharacterized protein n=1 Tax=Lentilactobacillus curieae TaxID=1138822 RepID=A0A1S6QJE0_9LACO|nr:hypothetical protein [Lentilactobacillus curieae]AQW21724.1 hypothetical protein PL11_007220 [Lentilactobacillus curieae]
MKGNYLFINSNPLANMVLSYGITGADFLNGIDDIPDNVLLLDNNVESANGFNSHSKFNLINGSGDVRRYILREPNRVKKFVDFESEDSLNSLNPFEIAELLYLAHMHTPMGRPYSSKLVNRYIYLSKGDGLMRTYYRKFSEFNHILEIAIKRKLREIHNSRRVFLRPLAIKDLEKSMLIDLVSKGGDGLFIDFEGLVEKHKTYPIPLRILNNPDGSSVVLKTSQVKENTRQVGTLTYNLKTSEWHLQWIDDEDLL